MKLLNWFIAALLLGALIFSCSKKDEFTPQMDVLTLPYGQWVQQDGVGFMLSDSILDSRCPETVVCIWQGMAEGLMTMNVQGVSHKLPFFIEGLCDATLSECGNSLDTLGYQVRFIRMDPYPLTTNEIPQDDYILQVEVVKK